MSHAMFDKEPLRLPLGCLYITAVQRLGDGLKIQKYVRFLLSLSLFRMRAIFYNSEPNVRIVYKDSCDTKSTQHPLLS